MSERAEARANLRFIQRFAPVARAGFEGLVEAHNVLQQEFDIYRVDPPTWEPDPAEEDPRIWTWVRTEWRDVPVVEEEAT